MWTAPEDSSPDTPAPSKRNRIAPSRPIVTPADRDLTQMVPHTEVPVRTMGFGTNDYGRPSPGHVPPMQLAPHPSPDLPPAPVGEERLGRGGKMKTAARPLATTTKTTTGTASERVRLPAPDTETWPCESGWRDSNPRPLDS
jgi:hypothetical protein